MFVLHLFRSRGILGFGIVASDALNFFGGGDKDWEIIKTIKICYALNGDHNNNKLQYYYYTNQQGITNRRNYPH